MNIVTRYVLVGIVSASLVAPAQAFDLRLWFNSLSERSRTAMYLGAATVVAGLSLLTYKLWNTKKVQPEVVKAADDKEQEIKTLLKDREGLNTQCEALDKEKTDLERKLKEQATAETAYREVHQKEAQQRAQDKERLKTTAQKIKNKLDELKQDHAKLKAGIEANFKSGLDSMNADIQNILGALQYKQERQLAALVQSNLDEQEVVAIIFALEHKTYDKISLSKELLLKSWSKKTHEKALDRFRNKQARIEQKKKKEQEIRDEAAKVTAAMDKALAVKSNGNGKNHKGQRSRFVVSEPVTGAKKAQKKDI